MHLKWEKQKESLINSNNMFQNKVIVFGCNHQNMLGLVRSLGEKGIRPYCVCLKSSDGFVFRSKYPALCYYAESPQIGYQYIIDNFSTEPLKPILLSSDDVTETMFDKNATILREHFIVPAADKDGKVTFLMEKKNIAELAQKFGFHTPRMWVVSSEADIIEEITFPVFTKSLKSIDGGKKEEGKCDNKDMLLQKLRNSVSGTLLVQQYIDKETEWCFQGCTNGEWVFLPYNMKYLRYTKNAFGGYVRLERNKKSEFIDQICALVKETKYKGMFSVEFILGKDGIAYFTEINFRHDGYSYFATTGGANLPYIYCMSCISSGFQVNETLKEMVVGMNESTDFSQFVKTKEMSMIEWLFQCLKADSHLLWNIRDNGPFWYMLRRLLLK